MKEFEERGFRSWKYSWLLRGRGETERERLLAVFKKESKIRERARERVPVYVCVNAGVCMSAGVCVCECLVWPVCVCSCLWFPWLSPRIGPERESYTSGGVWYIRCVIQCEHAQLNWVFSILRCLWRSKVSLVSPLPWLNKPNKGSLCTIVFFEEGFSKIIRFYCFLYSLRHVHEYFLLYTICWNSENPRRNLQKLNSQGSNCTAQ